MKDRYVRSIFKTFIYFSFCVIIFALHGGNAKSQEELKIAKPTITQYPNVQMEIVYSSTFRIEDIFDCKFYDPNKDSAFMKHLERNVVDIAFRKMVINNHYGAIISFSSPDHPSGSDTVFYPTKDTTICNALKKAKVISINNISCVGDHYPPCWLGIGGLVKEVCTEQNIASCGKISKIEPLPQNGELFFNFGQESLQEGEYDQAISDFSMAIEENPKYFQAFNGRGIAYYRKGQYDLAIADYSKAIELNSKDSMPYFNRGVSYAYKGQNDKAISDFSKAIGVNQNNSDAYFYRGVVYSNKGRYDNAISDYNKALEIDPKNAYAYANIGAAYFKLNNKESSCANYQKACDLGLCGGLEQAKKEGHCK